VFCHFLFLSVCVCVCVCVLGFNPSSAPPNRAPAVHGYRHFFCALSMQMCLCLSDIWEWKYVIQVMNINKYKRQTCDYVMFNIKESDVHGNVNQATIWDGVKVMTWRTTHTSNDIRYRTNVWSRSCSRTPSLGFMTENSWHHMCKLQDHTRCTHLHFNA